MSDLPLSTPLDVRQGLTNAEDVAHPLNWGIIGSGNISSQWVKSLQPVPGSNIVAIAAREQEKAQQFADRHDIPNAYGSYEELLASDEVQVDRLAASRRRACFSVQRARLRLAVKRREVHSRP